MFVHRMARDAAAAARSQHVSCRDGLRSTASLELDAQGLRLVVNRSHFGAELDLEAAALQVLAQDCLGAPLRKAALELVLAAGIGEMLAGDLAQARTEQLNVL